MFRETYAHVFEVARAQTRTGATLDDLYRTEGKAEIVDGKLVLMSPTGFLPGRAGYAICASLRAYEESTGRGYAVPDDVGFVVNLDNRRSFSPDAAFYVGEPSEGKFLDGAPIFAAEVRSEDDYGPAAEKRLAQKRADYFAAGTQVVWDVDVLREEVIRSYAADRPAPPNFFRPRPSRPCGTRAARLVHARRRPLQGQSKAAGSVGRAMVGGAFRSNQRRRPIAEAPISLHLDSVCNRHRASLPRSRRARVQGLADLRRLGLCGSRCARHGGTWGGNLRNPTQPYRLWH